MARITRPPQFSFDDSLVLLNRRQDPLTQTQRGNYEWTWAQARCWINSASEGATPVYEEQPIQVSSDDVLSFLMFGADVPQLAFYIAEETGQATYNANLEAFFVGVADWTAAINAWGATVTPALLPVTVPPVPQDAGFICDTRVSVLVRPPILPGWGTVQDAGQGSLVSVTYTNAAGAETFAQGFPLFIEDLFCGVPGRFLEGKVTTFLDHLTITVGYESQLNHGIGFAEATGAGVDAQTAYTPIVLRREDYSPAIYAAGNVIVQGNATLLVVGLWDKYAEPTT